MCCKLAAHKSVFPSQVTVASLAVIDGPLSTMTRSPLLLSVLLLGHLHCINTQGDISNISQLLNSLPLSNDSEATPTEATQNCETDFEFCPHKDYGAHSAYVPCQNLPLDFLDCDEVIDHRENATAHAEAGGVGCLRMGGQGYNGMLFRLFLLSSILMNARSFLQTSKRGVLGAVLMRKLNATVTEQ